MEEVGLKNKNNCIYKGMIICSSVLLISIIMDLFMWAGADDFTVSQLLMGSVGERTPFVLVINYYLAEVLVCFQNIFPIVNWLSVFEVVSVYLFFLITTVLLFLRNKHKYIYIIAIFWNLIAIHCYLTLTYTESAFFYSFSGAIIIISIVENQLISVNENTISKRKKCALFMAATLFFCLGVCFRSQCYLISIVYVALYALPRIIYFIRRGEKTARVLMYIITSICYLLVIGKLLGVGNSLYYEKNEEINIYRNENRIRSDVLDYLPDSYNKLNEQVRKYVSQNDYSMMKQYIIEDDFFSSDYYTKVSSNLNRSKGTIPEKGKIINNLLFNTTGREKNSYSFFLLMICIWAIVLIFLEKKKYIFGILNVLLTMTVSLFFILRGRFPSWVADPIYLISIFMALCIGGQDFFSTRGNNNIRIQNKDSRYRLVLGMFFLITISIIFQDIENTVGRRKYSCSLNNIINMAVADKDNLYVIDSFSNSPYPIIDLYGPFSEFEEGEWSNIIRIGNWDVNHPTRNKQLELWNKKYILSSLIDNNVRLISEVNSSTFQTYTLFFEEHYGMELEFNLVYKDGQYCIYDIRKK